MKGTFLWPYSNAEIFLNQGNLFMGVLNISNFQLDLLVVIKN